ncbi:hypothetical protein CUC08_Gglean013035 [Alternaria sp. MG1]|jgi:hypothetical protein|uniref:Uncharacterized protein n=1 Tax=Alternaria tenuissima TaxID=119927 RepID=A0ABY0FZK1_9PLEO|nr:hypothetical protein CUC08_Gglean013035 [Alternaria sp. MG1]RYN93387.1 hypothetical protein AA0119_g9515 [Alternaria tenuissima]RYO22322.1 hypothetical protein AA0121_g2674 [Alternaria tenuissima]
MPPTTTPIPPSLTNFRSRDPPDKMTPPRPSLELPRKATYSTNASTVKNRARIEKAKANDTVKFEEIKAQIATNKARLFTTAGFVI